MDVYGLDLGQLASISKYRGTTRTRYRYFLSVEVSTLVGWFIYNVIPGFSIQRIIFSEYNQ